MDRVRLGILSVGTMRGTMGKLISLLSVSFDHVVSRYTYSLVFAADMYATVFKKAPLDPKLGKLYRDKILFVGGSRDDMDSLKVSQVPVYGTEC